jgi:hypothetical protein
MTPEFLEPTPGMALFLRTCDALMQGHGGFQWPGVGGELTAPDWDSRPICGYGLHGLLWGLGSEMYLETDESAKGVVFEAEESSAVWIDGDKVKVPKARVLFVGTLEEAAAWLDKRKPSGERAGYRGTATAGDSGTATAGDSGTATAGDRGTATAGNGGVLSILRWNGKRYKVHVARVKDEDGDGELEPNVPYRLDDAGNFVRADGGAV